MLNRRCWFPGSFAHWSLAAALTSVLLLAGPGCSKDDPESAANPLAEAMENAVGYESPEALLEFLQSMKTAEDRIAMMELMWSRSLSDTATARVVGQLIEAQHDYVQKLAEKFDGAASQVLSSDLGIAAYAEALEGATLSDISPSRKAIDFTDELGQQRRLIAVEVLGKWRLHATSVKNGEEMKQVWFHPLQGRLRGVIRRYGDVVQKIDDGDITSVEAAEAAVRQISGDGPVQYGGIPYLTINAPLEPERAEPQTNVRSS